MFLNNTRSIAVQRFASAFKISRIPTLSIQSRLTTLTVQQQKQQSHGLGVRSYATSSPDNSQEFVQLRLQEITNKIKSSPKVLEAYHNLSQILADKGLHKGISSDSQPSFMEMIKIMSDADVQQGVQKIKREMEAANIEITKDDIAPLISLMKNKL